MTGLTSLDIPIEAAYLRFPSSDRVLTFTVAKQAYVLSKKALLQMCQMQLGMLPISVIALPEPLAQKIFQQPSSVTITTPEPLLSFSPAVTSALEAFSDFLVLHHVNAYVVGGIPRDFLLKPAQGKASWDIDLVLPADVPTLVTNLAQCESYFKVVQTYPLFGTAKIAYHDPKEPNPVTFELASTREESYTACGALPQIARLGVPLVEDVTRRDFTVNTLAVSLREPQCIIDSVHGMADLHDKQLRLLKPVSFFEDPSRLLRAFKFALRLGFDWSPETQFLRSQWLTVMSHIYAGGGERIRHELFELLNLPESPQKVEQLEQFLNLGLFSLVDTRITQIPSLPMSLSQISQRIYVLQMQLAPYWQANTAGVLYQTLFFAGLDETVSTLAQTRLGLTRTEMGLISQSYAFLSHNPIAALSMQTAVQQRYDVFCDLSFEAACLGVMLSPNLEEAMAVYRHYRAELLSIHLEITGEDILHLGVSPGPRVGQLLQAALHAKMAGTIQSRQDTLHWVKTRISEEEQQS